MAQGISTAKGASDETLAALTARCAALQASISEREREIAWMADRMAAMATAAEAPGPAAPEPTATAKAAPPSPAAIAFAKAEADLNAMAILAQEGRTVTTRKFWHSTLVQLGQHLAPDLPPTAQLQRALQDPRGRDFLQAKMDANS